jgi:hypothetical protein
MKKPIFILICLLIHGCQQEEFSPIKEFNAKLVIYCVLDPRNDIQLLRIQNNYSSWNITESSKLPDDVQAILIDNNNEEYFFKDTLIDNIENFKSYFCKGIKLHPGGYTLKISAKGFPLTYSVLNYPDESRLLKSYPTGKYSVSITSSTKNYKYHFYIYYEQKIDNKWVRNKMEIPTTITLLNGRSFTQFPGPEFIEDQQQNVGVINETVNEYTKNKILPLSNPGDIRIIGCWFIIENYDINSANYIKAVNGFYDLYSIRLDQIGYTNITNGYGVFGAIRVDSLDIF